MWEKQGGGNHTIATRLILYYYYYYHTHNITSYRVNTYLCTLPALEARRKDPIS